jgi:hypothetical protein
MGQRGYPLGEGHLLLVIARRFESIGEIDTGALVTPEAVAGLIEFQADLHVGNGVGGHQQLVAVQAW